MGYIELMNRFWKMNEEYSFTSYETQLYFKLLDTCNSLGWKNPFSNSNAHLCGTMGVSERKLIEVRNKLKQYGLIDFESGKIRRQLTQYTILGLPSVSLNDNLNGSLNDNLNGSLNGEKRSDNIRLKTRQDKTRISPPPPLGGCDSDFESGEKAKSAGTEKSSQDTGGAPEKSSQERTNSLPPAENTLFPDLLPSPPPPPSDGFDTAWELYGRKGNQKVSARRWSAMSRAHRKAAMQHIPRYVKSTPDVKYRKNFETYLNQEAWNDEIIESKQFKTNKNHELREKFSKNHSDFPSTL